MADRDVWRKNIPEDFDGRFGDKFDDEVAMGPVVQVTIGVVAACVAGFLIIWGMMVWNDDKVEASIPVAAPIDQANEQKLPTGPLLQADPEAELEAMRHEMSTRLNGYGWVDPSAGVVHIPIAQAIGLLAVDPESQGSEPGAETSASETAEGTPTEETPAEASPSESVDEDAHGDAQTSGTDA